MVKTPVMLYKTLVVGVIALFLGIAVQPSIATVEPEDIDVEYFDVTTEFIGLGKEYTTHLTKEEIQELDALFNSIYDRINKSKSHTETIEIFKEAVIVLDSYGLLGDVGIKDTEELVTKCYQNPKLMKTLERVYNGEKGPLDNKNLFCLIAGKTRGFVFLSPMVLTLTVLLIIIIYILENGGGDYYFDMLIAALALMMLAIPSIFIPFCLVRMIGFEDWAEGKIITFGLYGLKYWNGKLKGIIRGFEDINIGVLGFTGLKIEVFTLPNQYLLGFAPLVHIEES